ncbi:MAG: hypothetical protein M1812_005508 [Candelaria pacifica]|nr:MAG: hypothetical protein M1812_005508 [Candelaria pacifica]
MRDDEDESPSRAAVPSAQELLDRCNGLLKELDQFRDFLKLRSKQNTVEVRHFRNTVLSELKSLEKLTKADPEADRTRHTLRSSNLPFYTTVWTTAKQSTGLVAFSKRFYWEANQRTKSNLRPNKSLAHEEVLQSNFGTSQKQTLSALNRTKPSEDDASGQLQDLHLEAEERSSRVSNSSDRYKDKKNSALVDIVAQDGEEWIKVSTITEHRVLFEMAEAGWNADDSGPDDDSTSRSDDDNGLSLLRLAEDLKKAAKAVRVRYKHPQIRFVLPKLEEGRITQIDRLLNDIRAIGVVVQSASEVEALPTPLLNNVLDRLVVDDFAAFTPVLNIDCTILLALVSDLSHGRVAVEPWFHRAIRRQIELEEEEKLLPTFLFPAMGNKELVCTTEAAKRMKEIVDLIGTPAEKARTALLMGEEDGSTDGDYNRDSNGNDGHGDRITRQKNLVNSFRQYSEYEIPDEWNLPIRTVNGHIDITTLPPTASAVANNLTAINRSVFLYGWATNRTTISSNRTVAKLIETVIEESRTSEEDVGPDVWLCPTARSLVGKEKNRKN